MSGAGLVSGPRQRKGIEQSPHSGASASRVVRVEVERRRRLLVSHDALDVVDGHAVGDQPGRVRVAQVVEPQPTGGSAGDLLDGGGLGLEGFRHLAAGVVLPDAPVDALGLLDHLAQQSGPDERWTPHPDPEQRAADRSPTWFVNTSPASPCP